MRGYQLHAPLNILLAEDNQYDRNFFRKALEEISIASRITTVNDGEQLMQYLSDNSEPLPDFLFLDLNMPVKNGFECLSEIKQDKELSGFPVIIYTTSHPQNKNYEWSMINLLLKIGAHDFICKTYDMPQLKELIQHALNKTVDERTHSSFNE